MDYTYRPLYRAVYGKTVVTNGLKKGKAYRPLYRAVYNNI